ncbi:MAG: hypothetical protein K1X78_24345 [Verrucomicrobiaceae bacterium]|nr:hypothetical protein [Verrucomicrobiaceae bacterium]
MDRNQPLSFWKTACRDVGWIVALGAGTVLVGLAVYTFQNDSHHTGFEPWLLLAAFIPAAFVGGTLLLVPGCRAAAIFACITGFGGIGLLCYLESSNRLIQYDRWLQKGMP